MALRENAGCLRCKYTSNRSLRGSVSSTTRMTGASVLRGRRPASRRRGRWRFRCLFLQEIRINSPTPTHIALSAMLNAGKPISSNTMVEL